MPVLTTTWAYSYCPFAVALPTERIEAVLHRFVEAWQFFNAVPSELWWDNPRTVATRIFAGRQRRLNERYLALASHYNFEARGDIYIYISARRRAFYGSLPGPAKTWPRAVR